jgi:hypothetical protein
VISATAAAFSGLAISLLFFSTTKKKRPPKTDGREEKLYSANLRRAYGSLRSWVENGS